MNKRIYYIENNVQIFLPKNAYRIINRHLILKEFLYAFDSWLYHVNLAYKNVYKLKGYKHKYREPLFVIIVSRKHSNIYYLES